VTARSRIGFELPDRLDFVDVRGIGNKVEPTDVIFYGYAFVRPEDAYAVRAIPAH